MEIHDIGSRRLALLIEEGAFQEAYEIARGMEHRELADRIADIASGAEDTQVLDFLQFMLMQQESYENHELMCLAYKQMPWVDGAYYLAYFHAEEMYRQVPTLVNGLNMLFFNTVPDKPMSDDVAFAVLKKLMREFPGSRELREHQKRLGGKYFELSDTESDGED